MSRNFRSNAFANLQLAKEEQADGKAIKEIEHMFYAKLDSLDPLHSALEVMVQTQWGLWYDKDDNNAASGSVRMRRNEQARLVNGYLALAKMPAEFILTTKVKTGDGNAIETSVPSTIDMFRAFQFLADSGMHKHRYVIPIEGTDLKWEVDMFVTPGEEYHSTKYLPWCKIDLEVPSLDTPIPEFPAGFTEAFNTKGENLTEEQQKTVADMKQYLSLSNPHVKEVYQGLV